MFLTAVMAASTGPFPVAVSVKVSPSKLICTVAVSGRYARLAADDLQPRELYAHAAARGGRTHEYLQIARGDHLLLVGQLQKTLVYLVQLLAFGRVAYLCEVVLERRAAAAGRQDDARLVYSDILGVDYLIRLAAFEHAVLMYSRRVRKGVAADNGLVGLYGHTHEVRHKTARRDDLPRIDTYLEVEILVALYCHNDLLEGCVSGTFAQTVYRHLHLAGTVLDGSQRVGRGHAQIVVAVGRDDGLVDVGDVVLKVGDLGAVLARQTVTRRVGYVYDSGAGRDYGLHHAGQKLVLGAACILGVELHVIDETAGVLHRIDSLLDDRFGGHAKLFVDVVCRGADTRMDTAAFGELQRLGRHVDILLHGAREGTDDGARYRLRDLDHRVEVSRTRYREARFDDVHTQFFELPRHLDLLYGVELASRNLLRIAEGGVEDIYFFAHVMRKLGIGTGLRGPMPVRVLGD